MIKRWETPRIAVEKFEANEYVAACWGVKCDVDWANRYEWSQGMMGEVLRMIMPIAEALQIR